MSVLVEYFSREQIWIGLGWLDRALEQSEILAPVLPINLVSYGGMLAVCLFDSRETTRDVDVLLPPNIREERVYRDEFTRLKNAIADDLGYMRDWINDDMRLFVPAEDRQRLLEDSIEQGTAVYEGDNLVIWAGLYDFGLESKLRRMGDTNTDSAEGQKKYMRDRSDAVDFVHLIKGDLARPLDRAWVEKLRRYNFNSLIEPRIVDDVAESYISKYGTQGIATFVWDEARGKYRYQNLEGDWVWCEDRDLC